MRKSAGVASLLALVLIQQLAPAAPRAGTPGGQRSAQNKEPMSITVTSPVGGETWTRDGAYLIKWTSKGNPGATVNIYLMQGTVKVKALALNVPLSNNQFLWRIDKNMALGEDFSISVESAQSAAAIGRSPKFHIAKADNGISSDPVVPFIVKVTEPAPGTNWAADTGHRIEWKYTGSPPGLAKVLLMRQGQVIKTIDDHHSWGEEGTGYIMTYYMPCEIPPNSEYLIKVVSTTNNNLSGTSGYFAITPCFDLKITNPVLSNPPANWPVGSVHTITWTNTANCGTNVKIELVGGPGNATWPKYTIVASWPIGAGGSGSFQWTVPPNGTNGINWIYGKNYEIKVVCLENQKCSDQSAWFTISLYPGSGNP